MAVIEIPELSLIALIGPSGSGKSTFARKHFRATEVISSDFCRGLVSDDENDQGATTAAFEVLHFIAGKRLEGGRLTVVDATNVQQMARKPLIELARHYHAVPVAIVFNLPESLCQERNRDRPDRDFGSHVIRRQVQELRRSLRGLRREGFRYIFTLSSVDDVDTVAIERQPLWTNRSTEHGPFDIIGDVHGCFDELCQLLTRLGYERDTLDDGAATFRHPEGRKVVFLGDLVDRGPAIPSVLRLAMGMVEAGDALCIPGNHDVKLVRKLKGRDVQITHGLADSLAQLEQETPEFRARVVSFLDGLVSHYVLDEGNLVVAHAGMKAELQGRASGRVRDFALFGETTGETDEFGLPVRYNWAADYRGRSMVVYGHTPVPEAEWLNNTINIDTGCVFGGALTALRYPERELVSVQAARVYSPPIKPLNEEQARASFEQRPAHDLLDIEDVSGKRILSTRLHGKVTINEENAAAAIEAMSRFAIDPRWLIYLPPTMSPTETSALPGLLEHPAVAFGYYRSHGVNRVVIEEKHMGSRAIVIACRDKEAAAKRFGAIQGEIGVCFTRTGRRFFNDDQIEAEFLARVKQALEASDFWNRFSTDWVALDCELMPWSIKAQELIRQQYAPVGAAATLGLDAAVEVLRTAERRGIEVDSLRRRYEARSEMAHRYVDAYRHYCWDVESLADLKLAPFHVLATDGHVYVDRDHAWHMETIAEICQCDDQMLLATDHRVVDVTDPEAQAAAIHWWTELTANGGEGIVVKPFEFIAHDRRTLLQPAIKCRGAEYLRIIYGPEYSAEEHLERLRQRGLGRKRSLALREFALGIEALERFARDEPLYRVHECVFGVLALESEPVDPRL
jgi:protein phosphatase